MLCYNICNDIKTTSSRQKCRQAHFSATTISEKWLWPSNKTHITQLFQTYVQVSITMIIAITSSVWNEDNIMFHRCDWLYAALQRRGRSFVAMIRLPDVCTRTTTLIDYIWSMNMQTAHTSTARRGRNDYNILKADDLEATVSTDVRNNVKQCQSNDFGAERDDDLMSKLKVHLPSHRRWKSAFKCTCRIKRLWRSHMRTATSLNYF